MTKTRPRRSATPSRSTGQPDVKIEAFGPTATDIATAAQRIARDKAVQRLLNRTRHRLLYVDVLDPDDALKADRPRPADRFRATLYDYTNDRAIIVTGSFGRSGTLEVSESGQQPLPSTEEFDDAVQILSEDPDLGSNLRDGRVIPYQSMPPLIGELRPDGTSERIVAVGLLPREGMKGHEIVGVRLEPRQVLRFGMTPRGRAPQMAAAHNPICGLPYAGQPTASHVPGSVWVTITQGGTTLWRFQVVRPAASSGTNGSGIELRFVDFRGKRLLYRAHVPILNVKYNGNACGPYRDWQNQEGMIQANGVDVAPGFRLCSAPAGTILTTGSDTGNFLGVGIYIQGQEVVLVSEMQAGWYRYLSEWRFGTDGTLRPRFGFSAVQNSCVCNVHHHHIYWRFDFDIRTAGNNVVREFNNPPLGSSNWHDKNFEIRRPRDPARQRKWRVENKSTREAYDIVPGPNDGVSTMVPDTPFGRGDVWILRYRGSEIDDGSVAIGPPYEAGLDAWVNGEAVNGTDVVVWYGAHFTHDVAHDHPGEFGHTVGPDLKRVRW
jgi:Copper amine oxidase, enzyme domain